MKTTATETTCRVCGSDMACAVGVVEYVFGYAWTVSDCHTCGCRFTRHDSSVYNLLHESGAISYYADYRELGDECRSRFEQGDQEGLRSVLCRTPKYRFIIEQVSGIPASARILEVGCSRGYLTSYFILKGRHVLGVDVSSEAVGAARAAFGEHFALAGCPSIAGSGPHDLVYHVGMIGCVSDPVGLTKQLLAMLKPGGKLLFNSPNRAALHLRGQLWLDSAPPPDVVTLFPEGFWKRHFSNEAEVIEGVEMLPTDYALAVGLRKLCGRRWRKPAPQPLAPAGVGGHSWTQRAGRVWRVFERGVLKAARLTSLGRLSSPKPSDFGLFVQMTAR